MSQSAYNFFLFAPDFSHRILIWVSIPDRDKINYIYKITFMTVIQVTNQQHFKHPVKDIIYMQGSEKSACSRHMLIWLSVGSGFADVWYRDCSKTPETDYN